MHSSTLKSIFQVTYKHNIMINLFDGSPISELDIFYLKDEYFYLKDEYCFYRVQK